MFHFPFGDSSLRSSTSPSTAIAHRSISLHLSEKVGVGDELSDAVCVVFAEYIALAPSAQAVDVQFGATRTDAPGDLQRGALLFRIRGPSR